MADNSRLELVVEVDVNKANASIKSINTGLSSMEQAATKAASGASAGIDGMTMSMVKGATAGNLLADAIQSAMRLVKEFTIDAVKDAAHVQRMEVATLSLAKAHGINAAAVQAASEAIQKLGIEDEQALEAINKLIVADISLSKAEGLAKAAKDLAALKDNLNVGDALEAMVQAIEFGNARALRAVGLRVEFDKQLELAEYKLGRTLSDNEKTEIRRVAVMEAAAKATGAGAAATNTAEGQLALLNKELKDLRKEIGKEFVDEFRAIVQILRELVKWLGENVDLLKKFAQVILMVGGALATYKLVTLIGGIATAVRGLTAAMVAGRLAMIANPMALLITGGLAAGAIIYKQYTDMQEQAEARMKDMEREGLRRDIMSGKVGRNDSRLRGMSDGEIRDLLSGRRTIPGMGDEEDVPWKYDGPKLNIKGLKLKDVLGLGEHTNESTDGNIDAELERYKRLKDLGKRQADAAMEAHDYYMRAVEERANADRDMARARMEDSMKIIAATNSETLALKEEAHVAALALQEKLAGHARIQDEEKREIEQRTTYRDDRNVIRHFTLSKPALDEIHAATTRKIEAFDIQWNEEEARRVDAIFQAAMARSQKRFDEQVYAREQQAQWQGNVVDPSRRDAMLAAIEERRKAQLAPLEALPATTVQQKLAVENAKTAIERNGIDARVRMEQQEADWRAGLEDQARAARVQAVEQRKNLEVAQLEAVDAVTLQDKVRVEQLKTAIEVRAIRERAKIEMEQIDTQTNRQVLAAQRAAMAQGIFSQPYLDQLGDKIRELGQQEKEALQAATTSQVDVAQASSAAATRRIVTDHYRSIFDSLKQQAGGVFDALVTKSQSVWSAIGNSLKTALLTAIKDVVTSRVAATLMNMFVPGASVEMRQSGAGGAGIFGKLGGILGVGAIPVFGGGSGWTGPNQTPPGGMAFGGGSAGGIGGLALAGMAGGVPILVPTGAGDTAGAGGGVGIGGATPAAGGMLSKAGLAGFLPGLKSFFGFGENQWTDLGGGRMATGGWIGQYGSLGDKLTAVGKSNAALLAGGMLLLNGLQRGGWTGMAEDTAGGAMIGFKYGGPLGAAIGAAAGAVAGTVRMFIKGAADKAKEKIKALYGVDIADKGVLQQIVDTAKSAYGGNLDMAIRSQQVRDLIQLYAMTTGQKVSGMPGSVTPLSLVETGGSLFQSTTYQNGTPLPALAGLPSLDKVAGGTMTNAGGTIVIPLQIDSQAVGNVVIQNGRVVTQGAITAMKSNAGRREMTALQLSPGTLVS